jgi:hypothetical protein
VRSVEAKEDTDERASAQWEVGSWLLDRSRTVARKCNMIARFGNQRLGDVSRGGGTSGEANGGVINGAWCGVARRYWVGEVQRTTAKKNDQGATIWQKMTRIDGPKCLVDES